MGVGPWQLAVIVLLLLVLFGRNRLGEIGRGLGEGVRAFRKSMKDSGEAPGNDDDDDPDDDPPRKRTLPRRPGVESRRHVMAKRRKADDDERS
ncbi:MAG: twin-arginine translocase TatA/TatE family subunit [Polyangiaceae bacterium]|nr:twin-arginine translocase TatA/TatE family subunit [Polyangiaceae bacterium]